MIKPNFKLPMRRIKGKFKTSIRVKLIVSLLSVLVITVIGSSIISFRIVNDNILGQAYDDVQSDLRTAQYIYNDKIKVIHLFLEHLSSLNYLEDALVKNNRKLIINKLAEVRDELNLDILNITDAKGRVRVRSRNHGLYGDDVDKDIFVRYVLKHKRSCYGTGIITREYLLREGKDISDQAFIKVIPTPMAIRGDKRFEDKGMALKAASPIFHNGRLIGAIYGARLINNNFELVDRIKNLVFKDEKVNGFDIGTATIFMDDLRISTNVKKEDGTRAIGTQVSEVVYRKIFEQEKLWLDKAFVVNRWYISAYSPIYNIKKRVIGILYVGILEEKYNIIKRNTTIYYLMMTSIIALIAIAFSIYLIRSINNPIRSLVDASTEIAKGNYERKIKICSDDELGYLCTTFNQMVDAIVERDNKLKEKTERQIVQSEKLASLGRLASGIAHEINNPLTGVLSYGTVLLEELNGTDYEDDIQVIVDETMRCRKIVQGILEFARETKIEKENVNINKIINDSLSLLENHVSFQNIQIKRQLAQNIPEINLDINQMKSVVNNLAVNAADAMPDGGELTFSTHHNEEDKSVIIEVADTGMGISEENLGRIFDPFFTTKEIGKGTGLGLAVIYGIIKRHKGSIEVKSKVGEGTTFTVNLPVD